MRNEPAFPSDVKAFNKKGNPDFGQVSIVELKYSGLTKLEWFAGMAMSELAHPEAQVRDVNLYAKWVFDLAEAMLEESERRTEQ